MSNPDIVHTTDATFSQDVLKSEKPVLLDFWAEWCGPCKMIAPILDEIATEYKDKLRIAKIDIESNPQTPPKYGIRNIPTLILFKGGKPRSSEGRLGPQAGPQIISGRAPVRGYSGKSGPQSP